MKKLYALVVFLTIVFFASFVEAKEYTVVKGDSLWKIASKHAVKLQNVYEANKSKIHNPNLIYPGQKFIIPGKIERKSTENITRWTNPGANPFGSQRDYTRAIKLFSVPNDVRLKWIEAVKTGKRANHQIESGKDVFRQMVFDNYRVIRNLQAAWKDKSKFLAADKYSVVGDNGKIYVLYRPYICSNWSWNYGEKIEEIKPPAEVPPVIKIREEDKKQQLLMLLTPATTEIEVKQTSTQEEKVAVDICPTCQFKLSQDTYIFAGRYSGVEGDGAKAYYGIDSSLYLTECLLGNGKLKVGPSIVWAGWDGYIGKDFDRADYIGNKFLYGVAAMYETDSSRTRLKYRFGDKVGDITANFGQYQAHETAHLHQIDLDHEWWTGKQWFGFYKVGVTAIISEEEQKSATWNGVPVTDSPTGQGEITVRGRTHVYTGENDWIAVFVEGALGYRGFDHNKTGEIFVGVKHESGIEIGGAYEFVEGPNNDNIGIKAAIDIGDMIKFLTKKFSSTTVDGK